jgi:hypothetical protein
MDKDERDFLYKSILALAAIAEANINKIDSLNLSVQFLLSTIPQDVLVKDGMLDFTSRLHKLLDDEDEQVKKSYEMIGFVMEGARKYRGD